MHADLSVTDPELAHSQNPLLIQAEGGGPTPLLLLRARNGEASEAVTLGTEFTDVPQTSIMEINNISMQTSKRL